MSHRLTCCAIAALVGICANAATGLAQDVREAQPLVRTFAAAAAAAVPHVGSSPFSPPAADDTVFSVDTGSGLDTGCTYRSGGPLNINLDITRVVGAVGGGGLLADPGGLISGGFLSPKANLILPVFDIDVNGAPGVPPEVDRVFFNDHDLGTLTGGDGIWKVNQFVVDIAWVKFPSRAPGGRPTPAVNTIRIEIDQASAPIENWCMAVDWVNAEFKAIAPTFLVHGTNAQSDTWDPHFTAFFGDSLAPWSNDINLAANGGTAGNGRMLADRVKALADGFGAKKCHIVAHSKGGLDTRAFLNTFYDPDAVKVLSVHTLSTPHRGTIISDIIVAKRAAVNPESPNADLTYLIDHDYSWLSTPQEPAIGEQTTGAAAIFNARYPSVPGGIRFYSYGADADLNNNGTIQANETAEMIPAMVPNNMAAAAGTAMYRALGSTRSIRVVVGTRPGRLWGTNTYTSIEVASTNTPFLQNDLVVTEASARAPVGQYLRTLDANHSSMKTQAIAQEILTRIGSDFPVR